jgi:BirA family transcriptional regulator, biotin operon repressor / biotin---[acetyl-CoA-carboxylase] ligase
VSFTVGEQTAEWAKQSKLDLHFFKELKSTNDYAKENSLNGPISLIVTDHQTAGRGRKQNGWEDEAGQTLLSSWVFPLLHPPKPVTACRLGLATALALSATWPWLPFSLKAPNDIYLTDKKIAGLLTENIQQGKKNQLIIGLGLNVFARPLATSICLAEKSQLSEKIWHSFLDRLLLELSIAATRSAEELSFHEQQSLLYFLNQKPDLKEKFEAIDANGSLQTPSGLIDWHQL